MTIVNGKTDQPSYADPTENSSYEVTPLLTVGDEVPLLTGSFGDYTTDSTETFAMAGIPDGLGVYETEDSYYVFMNHEIDSSVFSAFNSTDSDKIKGARVSVFEFTKDWEIIGGKNLIETVVDNAVDKTYELNPTTGLYENPDNSQDLLNGVGAMSRFCSSFLATEGFVDPFNDNQATVMYFAPEEDDAPTDRGWAVTADGVAMSLDGLGRYSKENIVAATDYTPLSEGNTSNKTVLLSTEDYKDGELYMWVGEQTAEDPNGLQTGQLYVLQVSNSDTGEVYAYETMPEDVPVTAKWVAVPDNIARGVSGETAEETSQGLSDWVNANGQDGKPRSTNFRRLEDIAEDPTASGTFYFNVTGTGDIPAGSEEADNPYGKMYRLSLNPDDPSAEGTLTLVQEGGPQNGVSFDNLTVLDNGTVITQEDRAYPTSELGGGDIYTEENRDAYIWTYDPVTDTVTPSFELNEEDSSGDDPEVKGEWESSGVVQVSDSNQILFDVQAHTITDTDFVQGGQLILAEDTTEDPTVVYGTSHNDEFNSVLPDGKNFIGDNQSLITGGGNDTVDVVSALGGNRIDLGSGDDIVYAGKNNQLIGGSGNDAFYVGTGAGNNVLTGDEGADQFWIKTDDGSYPTNPNIISDFQAGTDVLGFANTSLNFNGLTIEQNGSDALISVGSQALAKLLNFEASLLNQTNFVFA